MDWTNKVAPTEDGCRLWLGTVRPDGYGVVNIRGTVYRVHRLFYEREIGPIPSGIHLHHVCGQRLCVEPSHMKLVTNEAHRTIHLDTRRTDGLFVGRPVSDRCGRGHNDWARTSGGKRYCRSCHRIYSQRQNIKRKAARAAERN